MPKPTPTPKRHTCPELEPAIVVTDLTGATQCQRIDARGIGRDSVIAAGLVEAVDVWSWVAQDTQVCFRAEGNAMVFLDAAYAPRRITALPMYQFDGLRCALIRGEGSVALLRSLPWGVASLPAQAPPQDQPVADSLSGCMVRLRAILNFRSEPGGEVMRELRAAITLTALRRTPNWFEVDYHGQRGWISAAYVDELGDCA